ncbi:hypothetical protein Taro_038654 [Colocasia esculenta]|uniref:BZIP domain-containing protein n=1 Tax=Colocasia esculenta TaxID=4460 RepID=A0A843WP97_COLES|nr:hypothetical protein [Colocasia esculenta]
MASPTAKPASSSGSDSDPHAAVDPRKRKRMESNRESARRSRLRKQQHLDELINQVTQLKGENARATSQIAAYDQQLTGLDSENAVLSARVAELTERLRSLNSVLRLIEEFSGTDMDIPELPDPLLEPWQLPCPSQPVMAPREMFQC